MKNNRILIVDGDNLLHRAYYKFTQFSSKDGKNSWAVYGVPYLINKLISQFHPEQIHIAFDGGRHEFRLNILPDYKKRDKHRLGFDYELFQYGKRQIRKYLTHFGVHCYHKLGFEADDIIFDLVREFWLKKKTVIIVSSDKDFNQLLKPRVSIFNPFKDSRINHITLKTHVGYTPEQTVDFLILTGDKSDNIPGYPGIGEKRAIELLKQTASISTFLKEKSTYKKVDNKLLALIYARNNALINLRVFYKKIMRKENLDDMLTPGKLNIMEIVSTAKEYDVTTFSDTKFLNNFKGLK